MARHLVGESIKIPVFFSIFSIDVIPLTDLVPELKEGLELLESPAAQQMLIYQIAGTGTGIYPYANGNPMHNSFLTEYQNMGYPTQGGIKNIAISNGSECGSPLDFNPYDPLFVADQSLYDLNYIVNLWINGWLLNWGAFITTDSDIRVDFDLRALPDRQSNRIYKGKIFIKKTILWLINVDEPLIDQRNVYSSTNMLALDNAGGGVYDIENIAGSLPADANDYLIERRFNFIPTFSSLDIGSGTQTITNNEIQRAYSPLVPPVSPYETPFANFYTNPTISEQHIQFTANNGLWLMDELKGLNAFNACIASCIGSSTLIINGPPKVCSSNISPFSVSNVPVDYDITWTHSTNLEYVSGQGTNNYVVKAKSGESPGEGWVQPALSSDCGPPVLFQAKYVWSGIPDGITGNMTGPATVSEAEAIWYSVPDESQEGGTFYWSLPSGFSITGGGNGYHNVQVWIQSGAQSGYVQVWKTNECGNGGARFIYVTVDNGGGGSCPKCIIELIATPNPVGSELDIKYADKETGVTVTYDAFVSEIEYVVTDLDGNVVFTKTSKKTRHKLNLSSIRKEGIYILSVNYGSGLGSERHRLVLER